MMRIEALGLSLFGQLHPLGAIPAAVIFGGLLVGTAHISKESVTVADVPLPPAGMEIESSRSWCGSSSGRRPRAEFRFSI